MPSRTRQRPFKIGERSDLLLAALFAVLFGGTVAAGVIWLSMHSNRVLSEEKHEELETQAALAALQFTAREIQAIDDPRDAATPLFRELVARTEKIRQQLPDAEYVYVMRKTEDASQLAFVLENDMLYSEEQLDIDDNGSLDDDEGTPAIGEVYDVSEMPALREDAFQKPASDPEITTDRWGSWMSGYAPIRDESGNAVAVLGIDMRADRYLALTRSIVSPALAGIITLGCILVALGFFLIYRSRRTRLLRQVDAQRRAMITVASHKLGGPVASIRWWLESLDGESAASKKQAREARSEMESAAKRLSEVIKHLDKATRLDGTEPDLFQRLARETKTEIGAKR